MTQSTVTVRNLVTGREYQARVRPWSEYVAELRADLAARWDAENAAEERPRDPSRNPWR